MPRALGVPTRRLDRISFDVIGYDVPEPAAIGLVALGAAVLVRRRNSIRGA